MAGSDVLASSDTWLAGMHYKIAVSALLLNRMGLSNQVDPFYSYV